MSKYVNMLVVELIEATKNKRITWEYNIYNNTFFSNKDNLPFQIIISPPTQNLFDLFKGFFPTILIKQNLNVHNEYILYSRKLGNHLIRTIKKSMKDTNFVYDLIDVIDIFVQEKQNTVALEYTSMKELPNLNKD
jgi:hypothetical protein